MIHNKNGFVELQVTYPENEIVVNMDELSRFYISFVVYDID